MQYTPNYFIQPCGIKSKTKNLGTHKIIVFVLKLIFEMCKSNTEHPVYLIS